MINPITNTMNTPYDSPAREFQRRRNKTWCLTRPWLFVMAAGVAVFAIPLLFPSKLSELWTLNLVFGGFIVIGIAIIRISIVVNREYRCPACNRTVIDYRADNGVPLDPEECPRCGIRLK